MQEIVAHDRCTGCSACMNRCPKSCISMKAGDGGFLYPVIDTATCIDCGQCHAVCPALHYDAYSGTALPRAYAAHQNNKDALEQCSSGGVFELLARDTLARGGAVFGAAFDDSYQVVHRCAETWEQAALFLQSKYVQSTIGNAYQEAKQLLDAGRPVLFTGTPCQISGLKLFLGKPYPQLLCQDIACHSVPSPQIWVDYLSELQKHQGSPVAEVLFRKKAPNWEGYHFQVRFENGTVHDCIGMDTPYMKAFINGLISRPSCYTCPFKGLTRDSDVTLADFWGVQQLCPSAYHAKGTSLVLLHTQEGMDAFERIKAHLAIQKVDPLLAVSANPAVTVPSKRSARYHRFWRQYKSDSFPQLVALCIRPSLGQRLHRAVRSSIFFRALRKLFR